MSSNNDVKKDPEGGQNRIKMDPKRGQNEGFGGHQNGSKWVPKGVRACYRIQGRFWDPPRMLCWRAFWAPEGVPGAIPKNFTCAWGPFLGGQNRSKIGQESVRKTVPQKSEQKHEIEVDLGPMSRSKKRVSLDTVVDFSVFGASDEKSGFGSQKSKFFVTLRGPKRGLKGDGI